MRLSWWICLPFLGALVVCSLAPGCSERERPARPYTLPTGSTGGAGGGDIFTGTGGGPCVTGGVCGNQLHKISFDVPNLYFVFDRSGSMSDKPVAGSSKTAYTLVRDAAIDLVKSLGPLINVGAALFPQGNIQVDACTDGDEVFPVTAGDPITYEDDEEGPTTQGFRAAISVTSQGGTPISATLSTLDPKLAQLSGRTIMLLLTDGGPNCNPQASCTDEECQPIIEGQCPLGDHCCDPSYPGGGPELCIDRPATLAGIQAVHGLGIDVYVIGVPGSEYYGGLLDEMAEAGGTAQSDAKTKYHKVDEFSKLSAVFAKIAADAISCEFQLEKPPEEKGFTNVYLDCELLPFDPVHGWGWKGDDVVWLHGDACDKLKSGKVAQVQIVTGCPTEVPK